MKYLLDAHTLLWFIAGNSNLSQVARRIIEDPRNERFVSIATLWEIAIKVNLGKLTMAVGFADLARNTCVRTQLQFFRSLLTTYTISPGCHFTTATRLIDCLSHKVSLSRYRF